MERAIKTLGERFGPLTRLSEERKGFLLLSGERMARLMAGLVATMLLARVATPAEFGEIAYAQSIIAIAAAVAGLGFEGFILRGIIRDPSVAAALIGLSIASRVMMLAMVLAVGTSIVWLTRPDGLHTAIPLAVMGFGALLQSGDAAELWFQARSRIFPIVRLRLVVMILALAAKLYCLRLTHGVLLFVAVTALESAAYGLGSVVQLNHYGVVLRSLRFDFKAARLMLRESWPIWLSGLLVTLYTRTAQLVLAHTHGDTEVALYHAATRLSEASYFLPGVLTTAMLPRLLRARDAEDNTYDIERLRYFRINALIGYTLAIPFILGARIFVDVLYGSGFEGSASVLAVHACTIPLAFLGVARGQHLQNEGRGHYALRFTVWGVFLNIGAHLIFTTRYGALGAAIAVLVAQLGVTLGASFIYPLTRKVGIEQLKSLFTPWRLGNSAP